MCVFDNPKAVLQEMKRVVKPTGRYINRYTLRTKINL